MAERKIRHFSCDLRNSNVFCDVTFRSAGHRETKSGATPWHCFAGCRPNQGKILVPRFFVVVEADEARLSPPNAKLPSRPLAKRPVSSIADVLSTSSH